MDYAAGVTRMMRMFVHHVQQKEDNAQIFEYTRKVVKHRMTESGVHRSWMMITNNETKKSSRDCECLQEEKLVWCICFLCRQNGQQPSLCLQSLDGGLGATM